MVRIINCDSVSLVKDGKIVSDTVYVRYKGKIQNMDKSKVQ